MNNTIHQELFCVVLTRDAAAACIRPSVPHGAVRGLTYTPGEMSATPSFIESPFNTKVEYEAFLKMPANEQAAALADLTAKVGSMTVAAESSAETWGPLEFPEARVAQIKAEFEKISGSPSGRVVLKAVHKLIFNAEERMEYDFDTWDTDLQATCDGCKDNMSWEDVLKFLKENL